MTDWLQTGCEPGVEDLLGDEEMAALLRRDGLEPDDVRTVVAAARQALRRRGELTRNTVAEAA